MLVYAVLVPPREELERARVLAASVSPVSDDPVEAQTEGRHRSTTGLFFRRRVPAAAPPPGPMLDLLPVAALNLIVAKFGNPSQVDAIRLGDQMEKQAPQWPSPRLRLAGGVALEPEGDRSVWVSLAGDLTALREVVHGVTMAAQGLRLLVDRRSFRSDIELGTINDRTTPEYLETLLAELSVFESNAWWQNTLLLVTPTDAKPGQPPYKTIREITLGPAVSH